MTILINWYLLCLFHDHPKLKNRCSVADIWKTLDLLFKLENNVAAQMAAMFELMIFIRAYNLSVLRVAN